ncbi:MAG: TIR domain-containing protein [Candidatus Nitrosopumilus sp. bin_7KS]
MVFKIFISYSQDDFFGRARGIHNYLSKMFPDDDIFIDQLKSKAKKWREENDEKLRECDLVILIITPGAQKSDEVTREIEIANEIQKLILPCKISALNLNWEELKWNIGTREGISFENDEELRTSLYGAVDKIRKEFPDKLQNISNLSSDAITVSVDRQTYSNGNIIIISGKVKELLSNVPVSLIIMSPQNQLVSISQAIVHSNKKYDTELTAGGALMQDEGNYTIKVQYGNISRSAETTFHFEGSTEISKSLTTVDTIVLEGSNSQIKYRISGGKIINAVKDPGVSSLIIDIEATKNGEINLTIPRDVLDAQIDNIDDSFFVLVDGDETSFDEVKASDERILTIPFSLNSREIEIIGISKSSKSASPLFNKQFTFGASLKLPDHTHAISISTSFDRTVYPLKSTLYIRVNCQDIIFGKPIDLAILNSKNEIITSKQIDPVTHPDSELKLAGIYQESFQMSETEMELDEVYTVRASHGNAWAEDTCVVDERTPIIQTDKSVYLMGSDMILTVIDPDGDKDSQEVEVIGTSPESFITISSSIDKIEGYPLCETGDSTGIFQGVIGLIGTLDDGTVMPYSHTENFSKFLEERGSANVGYLNFKQNDTIKIIYTRKSDVTTLVAHATNKIDLGTKK